jgi:hypothetical protein
VWRYISQILLPSTLHGQKHVTWYNNTWNWPSPIEFQTSRAPHILLKKSRIAWTYVSRKQWKKFETLNARFGSLYSVARGGPPSLALNPYCKWSAPAALLLQKQKELTEQSTDQSVEIFLITLFLHLNTYSLQLRNLFSIYRLLKTCLLLSFCQATKYCTWIHCTREWIQYIY